MFPLAPLTKGGVRALAAAAGLPTQARRDSQGICFLGKVPPDPEPYMELLPPLNWSATVDILLGPQGQQSPIHQL